MALPNTEGIDPIGLKNALDVPINPATEDTLSTLATQSQALSGASTHGSVVLSLANLWKQVPTTAPTSPYILIVEAEINTGVIRYSTSNTNTPDANNGNRFVSRPMVIEMGANQVLYFGSTVATDQVNWITKVI